MTTKTLTDRDGDTLHIDLWDSGLVTLHARQGDTWLGVGPLDPADLIAAIREAAGETDEPATPTVPTEEDFAKAEFARHEDGRTAHRCGPDTWQTTLPMEPWTTWLRADADMAAEGWQIVTPAEDSISRAELDARLARRDEAHKRQVARMQRHIETLQGHLARRREQMDQMREQMAAMTPAPSTPREALALVVDLAYEVEGDTMPDQNGHMTVCESGMISIFPEGTPVGMPARGTTYRRLLLDPPAPVTPEWYSARIVEATAGGSDRVEWARTEDGYWVALGGIARTVASSALSDVTVVVPGEVEA